MVQVAHTHELDTDIGPVSGPAPETAPGPVLSAVPSEAAVEREAGVLDLADAGQASARAAGMADRGEQAESDRLDRVAHRLYERADEHRRRADQLR